MTTYKVVMRRKEDGHLVHTSYQARNEKHVKEQVRQAFTDDRYRIARVVAQ